MDPIKAYSDNELHREQKRRQACRDAGICDFCGENYDVPACAEVKRHEAAGAHWYRDWHLVYYSCYLDAERGPFSLSISRYGTSVSIDFSGTGLTRADAVKADMTDRERFEAAIDWAANWLIENLPDDHPALTLLTK